MESAHGDRGGLADGSETRSELSFEGTSRTLEIDGGVMHYHDVGEGAPLVFLHGVSPDV
jgi:hypothetical protein